MPDLGHLELLMAIEMGTFSLSKAWNALWDNCTINLELYTKTMAFQRKNKAFFVFPGWVAKY